MWKSTTPRMSPKIPMSPKSLATGISATCTGTTSIATTARNHQSRPRKSIQAKAYPASEPITTTSTVAGTVISAVFHSELVIAWLSSSVR